ncbi:MAG TPA: SIMPL domain-containing protein [Limnobacter sp.]|nr:SIMPL domain-containing protein [Limnobacter sp.]
MFNFKPVSNALNKVIQSSLLGTALFVTGAASAWADLCEKTPAVNLNAVSSQEIDNDMVRLNWQVQVQAPTANEAMSAVNRVLDMSIQTLRTNSAIKNLRNNIQTYPQYGKDRSIQTWQGMGTLVFEMPVKSLQEQKSFALAQGLTLSNLEYFPSEPVIEKTKSGLLAQAMKEFQNKATLAANGFGSKGYTIGEVSINDEGQYGGGPIYPRMMAASADMMNKGMEVSTAAGASRVTVSVNGRVCLKP